MSVIFRNSFIENITEDEHALLYSIVNKERNQGVLYELAYCRARVVIDKLTKAELSEEGDSLRTSILEKFQTL